MTTRCLALLRSCGALPAPSDLGTKEFAWRCWLSPLTRMGWRTAILRSPCPRVTLQCPFALLSTDFAHLTTSLGFETLALEKLPFVFPQIATSSMLLQLLGNSNFPTSVRNLRLKALTITQLRPLDMRFRDQQDSAAPPQDISVRVPIVRAALRARTHTCPRLCAQCVMVLTEKRFLEHEIEFTVQTDLLDEQGTLWQSVTWLAVPFTQKTLLVPLSQSGFRIDPALLARSQDAPLTKSIACNGRNLAEFSHVATPDIVGANVRDKTPVLWMLGQVSAVLQRENRVPALPLMCNVRLEDDAASVALGASLAVESCVSAADEKSQTVQFAVKSGQASVMHGLLRTVGWTFTTPDESPEQ